MMTPAEIRTALQAANAAVTHAYQQWRQALEHGDTREIIHYRRGYDAQAARANALCRLLDPEP